MTGGARGIGEAIAGRLVRDGAAVALLDEAAEVEMTRERVGAVAALVGDVAHEGFVEAAVPEAARALGGLDVLVNNAAIGGPTTELVETAPAVLRRVLDVNLLGAALVARAAARVLVAQGTGGCIVNIGSIYGQQGVARAAAYCASKGGLALLTHSLALELAPDRIRVNTVAPGNIETEMHWEALRAAAAQAGTSFDDEVARLRAEIPIGRHGTGDDIAGAVAWLVSDDAAYVTGQTIGVNGGVVLT